MTVQLLQLIPSTSPTAVAEVLEEAAAYIETHGWCQGVSHDVHGHVCLVRAIGEAAKRRVANGHVGSSTLAIYTLAGHLGRHGVPEYLPRFNDAPTRTEAEVTDALKFCAKDLRSGKQAIEGNEGVPLIVL
jgi:hypothetical protein